MSSYISSLAATALLAMAQVCSAQSTTDCSANGNCPTQGQAVPDLAARQPRTYAGGIVAAGTGAPTMVVVPGSQAGDAAGTDPNVPAVGTPPMPAGAIDDAALGWTWHGMVETDDPQFIGGSGHAGGPGTWGIYTFRGTGVTVFGLGGPYVKIPGCRRQAMGSMKILIDGFLKADESLARNQFEYNLGVYTTDDLPAGYHVLQIVPEDGWIVLDYITVERGGPQMAAETSGSADGSSSGGNTADSGSAGSAGGGEHLVYLKSVGTGKYVSVEAGTNQLTADSMYAGPLEKFLAIDIRPNVIALYSLGSQHYVVDESAVGNALVAAAKVLDKPNLGPASMEWKRMPNGYFTLGSDGKFVTVSSVGYLVASAVSAGALETFEIVDATR